MQLSQIPYEYISKYRLIDCIKALIYNLYNIILYRKLQWYNIINQITTGRIGEEWKLIALFCIELIYLKSRCDIIYKR